MKFIKHRFHTNVLVPEYKAKEILAFEEKEARLEHLDRWQESERSNHHFKSGDIAMHIDNLTVPMHVDQILREKHKIEGKEVTKMIGVICHWYENVFKDFE